MLTTDVAMDATAPTVTVPETAAGAAADGEDQLLCEICKENEKLYKCPRCAIFTCSLKCCVAHKTQTQCSGKRDRGSFVAMQNFQEKHLRNDFHFLEDVLQTKGSAERTLVAMNESAKRVRRDNVFYRQKQLIKAAASRDITLNVLPRGMAKSVANTSRFFNKNNKMIWRVHLVFAISPSFDSADLLSTDLHNCHSISGVARGGAAANGPAAPPDAAEGGRAFAVLRKKRPLCDVAGRDAGGPAAVGALVGVCADGVDENVCLNDLVNGLVLNGTPLGSVLSHTLRSLRPHAQCGDDSGLVCLMQKIPSPASRPVFQEIPFGFNIRDALSGKTVLEYPTFIVSTAANLAHVERYIATVDAPCEEISTARGDSPRGNEKLTPTIVQGVKGLECYGTDDENDTSEATGESDRKRLKSSLQDEPSDGDEGVAGLVESEAEFLKALQEFETAGPEALKAFIEAEEKKGLKL